jgi:hypothetical protein
MAYRHSGPHRGAANALARGLGWFSIALGLGELLAAQRLTRALGMEGQEGLVQAYGVREIATGLGILAADDPTPWIWGRVAGDALDLATLAPALDRRNRERDRVGLALGMVAGVTAIDIACAQALRAERQPSPPPRDYSDRVGMPRSPEEMRGAAREVRLAAHIDDALVEHPRGTAGEAHRDAASSDPEVAAGHPS